MKKIISDMKYFLHCAFSAFTKEKHFTTNEYIPPNFFPKCTPKINSFFKSWKRSFLR